MTNKYTSDEIKFALNKNEAIVLFEFLHRFSEENRLEIEDRSEKRVLWNLGCDLEKLLVKPFQSSYLETLSEARQNMRNKND